MSHAARWLFALVAACAAPATRAVSPPSRAEPADAVRAYHDGFAAGDAARVRGAIGDTLVMAGGNYSSEPTDWGAHQYLEGAALARWPAWMLREAGPHDNRVEVLRVSVRGNAAVVVTRETGSNRFRSWSDETVTYLVGRGDGGWKIVGLFIRDIRNPEDDRARDEAAAAIRALGGRIEVDATLPGKPVVAIDLHETAVTDDDLARLAAFPELRALDLRKTRITERAASHLRKLPRLRTLNLFRTAIGDETLDAVAGMRDLETLLVGGTRVSDDGIARLAGLAHLRKLSVFETAVGDAGVARLATLPRLEVLLISGSRVTEAGALALQKAIPGLRFSEPT